MDPRRLLTFRAVARERSFSDAARTLNLSQPSVSQQIAQLETEAGVRLFERGRGGLRLTHAGDVLLGHVDQIAWRLELARQQLSELSDERRSSLRIGAFPTALASFIPEVMARFKHHHDDVSVLMREVTPFTFEERLLRGEFDLAVGYQNASDERHEYGDATRVDLMQETFVLALPATHPLADSTDPISIARFADDDWVVASTGGFIMQAIRSAGIEPHIVSVTQSSSGMIAKGLAVGFMPSVLHRPSPDIVLRPTTERMPVRDIFAVVPPGEPHPLVPRGLEVMHEAAQALA